MAKKRPPLPETDALLEALGGRGRYPYKYKALKLLIDRDKRLLLEFFPDEDYTLVGLDTLLSMEKRSKKPDFRSPADLLLLQIEEGKQYRLIEKDSWAWIPSRFRRNTDGRCPADNVHPDGSHGFTADEDATVALNRQYKGIPIDDPHRFNLEVGQLVYDLSRQIGITAPMLQEPVQAIMVERNQVMAPLKKAQQNDGFDIFELLYISSLQHAIEAEETAIAARAQYSQLLDAELESLASEDRIDR